MARDGGSPEGRPQGLELGDWDGVLRYGLAELPLGPTSDDPLYLQEVTPWSSDVVVDGDRIEVAGTDPWG